MVVREMTPILKQYKSQEECTECGTPLSKNTENIASYGGGMLCSHECLRVSLGILIKTDFESWLNRFYDDLYCEFMEQGLQYDNIDFQDWAESRYDKLSNSGSINDKQN